MNDLVSQVRDNIEKYQMLQPGDRVIVAVSGGGDSICLLWILQQIAHTLPVSLRVVHVHHGLRGEEADRDEAYVKELCDRLNIPFLSVRKDVAGYAKENHLSTEEAGRILRYQILEDEAAKWDEEAAKLDEDAAKWDEEAKDGRQAKIALAHHRDDDSETILHNLVRGSGLRGISGIQPVTGRRIRPLLNTSKKDILAFLKEEAVDWKEDSTNASDDYTRNYIRNQILPMMEDNINSCASENIHRAGKQIMEADHYLKGVAEKIWEKAGAVGEDWVEISLDTFLNEEEIIKSYLISHMLDLAAPKRKDIGSVHYGQLMQLAEGKSGSRIHLPCGLEGIKTYETLRIGQKKDEAVGDIDQTRKVEEVFEIKVFPREKAGGIPKNQYTKWFDYDRIYGTLSVRTRQEGDYISLSDGGTKSISRFMIDEKIPRQQRDQILLLTEENHVLWVVGYRISEYYKVTDTTKTVLQVTFDKGVQ